jgi:hypothetical protein
MGQRRIYEFNFAEFSQMLRKAGIKGKKLEKTNKEAWKVFVKKHNVPEAAILSRGKNGTMSGKVDLIIIEGMGRYDGYYVYCSGEQFCLKFESELD